MYNSGQIYRENTQHFKLYSIPILLLTLENPLVSLDKFLLAMYSFPIAVTKDEASDFYFTQNLRLVHTELNMHIPNCKIDCVVINEHLKRD